MARKKRMLAATVLCSGVLLGAQSGNNPMTSIWTNPKEKVFLRFTECVKDTSWNGKICKEEPAATDTGRIVFKNLKYKETDNIYLGKMIPPGKNIELDATISFPSIDTMRVVARKFLLTKTITFVKVENK